MARTVEEYLQLVIPKISKKIIDSIGEGMLLDRPLAKHSFYQSLSHTSFKIRHDYDKDVSIMDLLDMCQKYMVSMAIKNGKSKEEAIRYYGRFFCYKRQRERLVTVETLTAEVVDYLKKGGDFENKAVKSYPFYEKFRTFIRNNEKYHNLTFFEILELVRDYYFDNIDKFSNGDKKLTKDDFAFSKVLPIYTVTIQSLTDEVLMYIRNGGEMDYESKSNLPFYRKFHTYIAQKEDKENWDFHRVLEEIKNYYFANIYPNEEEKDRLSQIDFVVKDGKSNDITIDVLAQDLVKYVSNGGNLIDDENERQHLPFDYRFRIYIKKQIAKGIDIDYVDLMEMIIEHYLSNIAPTLNEKDRLSKEDFKVEMYHKHINRCRSKTLRKMNQLLQSIADEDGCVDSLYEHEKIYSLMKNLSNEYGMTIFEIVALLLPKNSKLYLTKGDVHTEYISDIGYLIADFVHKYGAKNFVSNAYKYDLNLIGRLKHLSRYFPKGSQSISDVLDFYGIYDGRECDAEYEKIDEDMIISYVRKKYEEAINEYFKTHNDSAYIDMEWINKRMGLRENKDLYRQLTLLALRDDMALIDYLNSKEIVCNDTIQSESGSNLLIRKKINGKEIPAFEYVIGNPRPRLSRTAVKKGKEYTFYLRKLMNEKIRNSMILNEENHSSDEKFEERLQLVSSVIEESIELNYHSKNNKKRSIDSK